MKMVVGYIDREMFEPIREELLDLGFLSITVMDAAGSMPEPVTTGKYRGVTMERHVRAKARLEAVVGDEHVQTVVDTIVKQGERTFTVVLPVEAAFPLATVKEGDEQTVAAS
jgi:nitrogen regulatory protein PII